MIVNGILLVYVRLIYVYVPEGGSVVRNTWIKARGVRLVKA